MTDLPILQSSFICHLLFIFLSFTAVCHQHLLSEFCMKHLRHLPSFLRNKYLLTLSVFVVWMLFFDRNDFFTQLERRRNLAEIEQSKAYYTQKIDESKTFSKEMQTNAAAIEKFAREKYLMKRENEDLFLVQKPAGQ